MISFEKETDRFTNNLHEDTFLVETSTSKYPDSMLSIQCETH